MPETTQQAPQTPRQQSRIAAEEAAAAIIVALSALFAASAYAGALSAAGFTLQALSARLVALYTPLVAARILLLRRQADAEFTDALPTSGSFDDLVAGFMADELRWEQVFMERSARRIFATLERAARDGDDIDDAYTRALARERRLNHIRQVAAERRLFLRIEEASVQSVSPQGAYWLIDPSKRTHTEDCLAMAGHAWSWEVLRKIRPSNRHHQCGCRLIPIQLAKANSMAGSNRVRNDPPWGKNLAH